MSAICKRPYKIYLVFFFVVVVVFIDIIIRLITSGLLQGNWLIIVAMGILSMSWTCAVKEATGYFCVCVV